MTQKYAKQWIQEWCQENGWTDLFVERYHYWAFPPGGVIPQPIPFLALRQIKQEKGLSPSEKGWYGSLVGITCGAIVWTAWSHCPLPLVFAFGFCAIAVAYLDEGVPTL